MCGLPQEFAFALPGGDGGGGGGGGRGGSKVAGGAFAAPSSKLGGGAPTGLGTGTALTHLRAVDDAVHPAAQHLREGVTADVVATVPRPGRYARCEAIEARQR